MTFNKGVYYSIAIGFLMLAVAYCSAVYMAGDYHGLQVGTYYLLGIPNYFLFYIAFLPFITVGVLYLACENRYIRFVGTLSSDLDSAILRKVRMGQKILPLLCIVFCTLIVVNDAADKNHDLPPYAYSFGDIAQQEEVARYFACAKGWEDCPGLQEETTSQQYLKVLQKNGFSGESPTGFNSFELWMHDSSWLYWCDSILSLLATIVISLFMSQIFLLIIVKSHVKTATRNLVMWMLILTSFWFPTKVYTIWSSHFGDFFMPPIFIFGLVLLAIAVVLLFFIKTERNDIIKIASGVVALFSFGLSIASYFKPSILETGMEIILKLGCTYSSMLLILLLISSFLITDHFLSDYDREVAHIQ